MGKHAYLIMAHNESEILKVLLELLDYPLNDIFLHIDKRSVKLREFVQEIRLKQATLHLLSNPRAVYWGDLSQVEVELYLFETAFFKGPYAYYHLLSGVDLPIKSQQEIHAYFHLHKGKEFVGYWLDKRHQRDLERKVCRYHFFTKYAKGGPVLKHSVCAFLRNTSLALQKVTRYRRKVDVELKKGYNWVSITQEFCAYLIQHREEILRMFRYTLCPDEVFLQTVLWNSPFKERIYSLKSASEGSLRAIDWERGNPYVWQANDVDELLKSPYLFARKFSSSQVEAVARIKEALGQR